jgi:hypothetical protein
MFRIASKRLRRTFWQEGRFHLPTVGAEMMKHGDAMLTGLPLDVADRAFSRC